MLHWQARVGATSADRGGRTGVWLPHSDWQRPWRLSAWRCLEEALWALRRRHRRIGRIGSAIARVQHPASSIKPADLARAGEYQRYPWAQACAEAAQRRYLVPRITQSIWSACSSAPLRGVGPCLPAGRRAFPGIPMASGAGARDGPTHLQRLQDGLPERGVSRGYRLAEQWDPERSSPLSARARRSDALVTTRGPASPASFVPGR